MDLLQRLTWQTVADTLCFILILRFLMAWLMANRRVMRMALTLLAFGLFILAVSIFEFPLTRLLTTAIAGPLVVLLLLSFLPEIRRAYEDAKLFNFFGPPQKKKPANSSPNSLPLSSRCVSAGSV
ncbi:MAG: hypothetical protein HC904_04895, partial [Blastochloris sp.]|nr:hypothetical protein [Blastochloris sp.]